MKQVRKTFIVVEGPIGVGKTTLVNHLAKHFDSEVMLERPEENPFLKQFYNQKQRNALATQLFFLFQRVQQVSELRQNDLFASNVIADFMLEKDMLFAKAILDDDEYRLYRQIYDHIQPQAPVPDLVVYLQAPASTLMRRIRKRNVAEERSITEDYLEHVSNAYSGFFTRYDQAPLLIINTEQIDLATNSKHLDSIISQVEQHQAGRAYYNPEPSLL